MGAVEFDIDPVGTLRGLAERLRDPSPALRAIGALIVADSQTAFKRQRLGSKPWASRMTPNVPGIVGDLNAGRRPPARRFDPRPALVDTGRLRQSITFEVSGNKVTVGTPLKYASIQQSGGKQRVTLTATGRSNLVAYLRQNRDLTEELGWLFRKPSFEVEVRARPFIGVEDDTLEEIAEILEDYFGG